MGDMKILDIGCGESKFKSIGNDVVGLDVEKHPGVDVICDLEGGRLPFDDRSFDMVVGSNIMEHLSNPIRIFDEVWRILKPGGTFDMTVPHRSNPRAYDVYHKSTVWAMSTVHRTVCSLWGDRYYQDSLCFDVNFRCEVECSNYGRNFTGTRNGCGCDCGDGEVSYCSGFFYPYDESTEG